MLSFFFPSIQNCTVVVSLHFLFKVWPITASYHSRRSHFYLIFILSAGTNFASKFLWANGITLLKVREEIVKLRGKPDLYFFSPEHPPLTEDAQRALDWAIDEKIKSGEFPHLHIFNSVF